MYDSHIDGTTLGTNAVGSTLYIAANGDDTWSGNLPDPLPDRTDGPLATLERARDLLRQTAPHPEGATVFVRGGIYERNACFELDERDSGTPDALVVYRACPDETPRLLGGRRIGPFTAVADPQIRARLPEEARPHVRQCDLKTLDIADFGRFTSRGFGRPTSPAHLELFFQDRRMEVARWPNDHFAHIEAPAALKAEGDEHGGEMGILEAGFLFADRRPADWQSLDDIWIYGYWGWDWAGSFEQMASYDPDRHLITTRPPHGLYGFRSDQRFYFLNVLEELDRPGEYYLDRSTGILYFWPPAPLEEGEAIVSLLEKPLIRTSEASHISIEGLTLECTRGPGAEVRGGTGVTLAGCTLRNLGNYAVAVEGGTQHGVESCDISDTGDRGISLRGGDRSSLAPANHRAVNNHITRVGAWSRCYQPGVIVEGVGNRVAHNWIHHAPHIAVLLHGNEHQIELNHIHHVCLETGDAGAFYMGRDWTEQGNVIRHNFFHHTQGVGMGTMAVYLDDCASGAVVYGNIFYECTRAAFVGGGRNNRIDNNIFVDCQPAVQIDGRGLNPNPVWQNMIYSTMKERLDAIDHHSPPYSVRYPHLAELDTYYQVPGGIPPEGNLVIRNICRGGEWLQIHWHADPHLVAVQHNLTDQDPRFVDADNMNFALEEDSPAYELGFKPIPMERIGLYRDEYRSALPATNWRTAHHG